MHRNKITTLLVEEHLENYDQRFLKGSQTFLFSSYFVLSSTKDNYDFVSIPIISFLKILTCSCDT